MDRIGNLLPHLMLGLSSSLELVPLDQLSQGLLDTSLQAFAPMTRELGCTLSSLVHAWCQMWLAQSSLTEPCRRTLRALPLVPGELFGSAALEALERAAQASRTQQQPAGLHRPPRRPLAAGAARGSLWGSFPPPFPFLGSTSMALRPRPARAQGDNGGAQDSRPAFQGPGGPLVMIWSRLSYWAVHTPDSWVLSTLSRGYHLQFRRRPPVPS
ncbi:hypothetical protein CRENBAI_021924 [Crenichthys baileyi]|uniref:Uncharacterized protein n=1 Tax=Crenichthys baileyi TaxID=28760 RepID=A0AAV9QSC5_9TELE